MATNPSFSMRFLLVSIIFIAHLSDQSEFLNGFSEISTPKTHFLVKIPIFRQLSDAFENLGRASRKYRHFALALGLGLLLSASPGLQAQTIWRGTGSTGGDGDWSTGTEWSAGVPVSSTEAIFQVDATSTGTSAVIQVTGAQAAKSILTGLGKATTLQMAAEASITVAGADSYFGSSYGTGTLASSFTFQGPATGSATVGFASLSLYGNANGSGNSLIFSGSLGVTASTVTIGRYSSKSTILVSGVGSSLTATSLNFATGGAYFSNLLKVENGGKLNTGGLTSTIGTGAGSYSNTLQVTGANSDAIMGPMRVGDAVSANLGGNSIQIDNFGIARSGSTLDINPYNVVGSNFGSNFVLVGANGTLTSSNTITVKDKAALRLSATGKIEGRNTAGVAATATISVLSGGRFEATGPGLGATTTVNTTVSNGGTLAVGLDEAVTAGTLVLSYTSSKMTLNTGSTLEFGIFGNGLNDNIDFTAVNIMTIQSGVNLRLTLEGYVPTAGNSWMLITGAGFVTGSASNLAGANFDLPTLGGGLSWNTTMFNQTDGWKVSVVPEPSTLMLLGFSLGTLLYFRRKKAYASPPTAHPEGQRTLDGW